MAKYLPGRTILFIGRMDPVTIYRSGGKVILRAVSNLTGERVKKDPKFRRTMANAAVLGRASRIGSFVYRELPKTFRQFWMYKAFTGEVIQLLREGKSEKEAQDILWNTYAEVWVKKEVCLLPAVITDVKSVTTDKKKKVLPFVRISGDLNDEIKQYPGKYEKVNTISTVIPLLSSHKMIRRRRIRRA